VPHFYLEVVIFLFHGRNSGQQRRRGAKRETPKHAVRQLLQIEGGNSTYTFPIAVRNVSVG
jgi:hypothetical protein